MATLPGWTLFGRFKPPKPPKPAVSNFVRSRLDEMYKVNGEPSDELREDFRLYMAIKGRIRRAA